MGRRRRRGQGTGNRGLTNLKYDVAQEIGLLAPHQRSDDEYFAALDRQKYEVADELGLTDQIRRMGWANMTSRDCGRVGGQIGGLIGGSMVRRMVEYAREHLG